MSCITPPKYVINTLKRIESHGYSAYMVGGCVRDIIMNRRPNDWDICTSALPEEIISIFPNSRPTGIKHGTVTVFDHGSAVEVTTFRADGNYLDHRRPDKVSFITDLRGDLQRRDFTVNAIALPLSGLIFDPFDGRIDIENRQIRCVGEPDRRFNEDALRMFRAFRFSAVLGFNIEEETLHAVIKNASLAETLSCERICTEIEKILLSNSPQIINDLIKTGLLNSFVNNDKEINTEGLTKIPSCRGQRWAGLCALLIKNGIIDDAEDFLRSLRLDSATIHNSSVGCNLALTGISRDKLTFKKLLSRNGIDVVKCVAAAAECLYGTGYIRILNSVIKSGECYSLKRLAVSGDDLLVLGYRGTELGNTLYTLLDHVIRNPKDNRKDLLIDMVKKMSKSEEQNADFLNQN